MATGSVPIKLDYAQHHVYQGLPVGLQTISNNR